MLLFFFQGWLPFTGEIRLLGLFWPQYAAVVDVSDPLAQPCDGFTVQPMKTSNLGTDSRSLLSIDVVASWIRSLL